MKINKTYKFSSLEVKVRFDHYTPQQKNKLLFLRNLIFEIASQIENVGKLTESLKWNEPSYVSSKPKVGSPIRINSIKNSDEYAMFFNCNTNLVSTFRQIYSDTFSFSENRAIIFKLDDSIPLKELTHCISLALTYHLNKKLLNPTN